MEKETLSAEDKLYRQRHSLAHVLAAAVQREYPEAKFGIGPPIKDGFYYDFDLPESITIEKLAEIEKIVQQILSEDHEFVLSEMSREEALERFADQPYKIELIENLPADEKITGYQVEEFFDLCRGPHVENTKEIRKAGLKLLHVAGAYWRGDEKRPMLQRIYAAAFSNPKELRTHLNKLAEAEKRDHRKVGRALDLFSTHEEAGSGLIYWHPKGARVRVAIEDFWREEHFNNGYDLLFTPHIGKSWLWETSGHLDFYKEGMFSPMEIDGAEYYAKPMNCPFHILIYKDTKRSYREHPLRWAELGTVYRYERSGTLHGMMRVRGFTQDDAHIFCTHEQVEDEIKEVLRFSLHILASLGFNDYQICVSTRPEKSVGDHKTWDLTTQSLLQAVKDEGHDYIIDEGGGAFYGPKIDIKINDAIGRSWQLSTIQFDFNLPERFDLTYVAKDGSDQRPYVIHRALLGSLERFFGILIEHYNGAFPVWIAPEQIRIIPVANVFDDYAEKIRAELKVLAPHWRIKCDLKDDRMNAKIRNAQNEKVPYMFILGEQEQANNSITIRKRTGEQLQNQSIEETLKYINTVISEKTLL